MISIRENILYEGIVSFKTESGIYATPMGFTIRNNLVHIRVYHGSLTHNYLRSIRKIVLNIADDPYLYLYLAFKKETNGLGKVSFVEVEDNAPVLESAKAYAILNLKETTPCSDYDTFIYNYGDFVVRNPVIEPISRCRSMAIEALIYLTKLMKIRVYRVEKPSIESYLKNVIENMERLCVDPYHEELVNNIIRIYRSMV